MSLLNLNENESDYLQIKLTSEAFEEGYPTFYKTNPDKYYEDISTIHKLLFHLQKNKPLSINIEYKKIEDEKFIDDIMDLFKEWFPITYDRDYLRKYFIRQNCIAIGAFIKINSVEYLVGCVLGEIISDEKFKKIIPDLLAQKSWFFLSEPEPLDCAVLQNIGVIDEYRRLGVGTRLMEKFEEEVKSREAVAIYLITLTHNSSSIKFFENNQWHYYDKMNQYYRIDGKNYDAIIYYYIINLKKCNKLKEKKYTNINEKSNDGKGKGGKAEEGVSEIGIKEEKGCLASILSFFSPNKD